MPVCTLHLLALDESTDPRFFVQRLKETPTKVIVTSRPRHVVIHPTELDNDPLATKRWDLMVLLQATADNPDPIPAALRSSITDEYKITTGIPSKLVSSYPSRNATLQKQSSKYPLTDSLENYLKDGGKSTSQNLEVSPSLLAFMAELTKTHPGPVTMLNLLHFQYPNGKQSYYQYGQAFIPVAGKRGGNAKLVGNVVPLQSPRSDSRGSPGRPEQDWWNEISIVHYPSIRHFCDMLAGEDYQAINEKYRLSALRDTFLLCTTELDVEGLVYSKL
ncbi:hypothetical protein N7532_008584 [Penicillium argentinense]|uniref:Uncharacterized protein n=1 Tax=Penicillium argentinense TaxID=1131581 RepID=A0A9W9EY17_9EURO|nr:uncharacterized protein N7532_008584 [Penicillium argentinense]KAJ5089900.1 hypothetical protein N7532_008584 [Penicillium argentinense]